MASLSNDPVAADDCISDDSSFHGSPPPSSCTSPTAYLSYQSRTPTVIANSLVHTQKPLHNPFEGYPAQGKQLNETVSDFVTRLPPSSTYASSRFITKDSDVSGDGSWIWVANPYVEPSARVYGNEGAFVRQGREALMQFLDLKSDLSAEIDKRGKGSLERQLSKPREELVERLKAYARKYEVKSGKWMIFCMPDRVDKIWQRVCEGMVEGVLGPTAKVARREQKAEGEKGREEQVICIYTRDFEDEGDVKRVLMGLRDLGLVSREDKRGIWYKCDAWTLLQVNSGNEYGMKASLYGSGAVLNERKGK